MRGSLWPKFLSTVLLVVAVASCAVAQDWPQWRGPNRDGQVLGFPAPSEWPAGIAQKWSIAVGAGAATPAVVGDKIFVFARQGDQEVALCINAADGSEVWKDAYAAPAATGPAGRHPGPRSSPAVAEGKVLTLGLTGILSCLDAATGALVWRKDPFPGVTPEFYTASSPMILDGMAIAQLGGKGNGALMAFDLATGDVKWQWAEEGPDYASPVVLTVGDSKQIVALTEKSVVGVAAADGKLLWQLPFVPQSRAYNAATPIVDGTTVYYTGSRRGTFAVSIETTDAGFAATELWNNPDIACQFSTPVLANGCLFGLSDRGNLFCLDASTGQAAWTDTNQLDRGSFGPMLRLGPVVLVLPSSGELVCFEASRDAYSEIGRFKLAQTPTYAHPVLTAQGALVKDQDNLTLWTVQ